MDQCTRCSCHGDVEACETTQCTYHDLWYVKHLRARIAALQQAESGGSAATNKPRSAISALASEWILKHGMAPAFKSELRAFARWAQKQSSIG